VDGTLTTSTPAARDLRALFDPKTVAIVGASATVGKWGNWLARNALRGKDRRRVFLVNRTAVEILGEPVYPTVGDVPETPELVVITIGSAGFEQAVEDALAAGALAIVGITAALGELGGASLETQRRLAGRVREAGAVLVGPNCLGVADTGTGLNVAFGEFVPGPMAVVSQSGNIALELAKVSAKRGLGISRFISLGNQSDLTATELVDVLAGHEPTRVIAVYVEDFGDGREFLRAAQRSRAAGKPVVLLTVGSSRPAASAARSHTGALVSSSIAVEAACRAGGVLRVATSGEAVDLTLGLLMTRLPRGPRVGVVGDGGGHVALAADLLSEHGLAVPVLTQHLADRIAARLPANAATANPVDLAGGGERDFFNYSNTVQALLESGEVDSVMLTGYFGGYSEDDPQLARIERDVARAMAAAVEESNRPLIVQSMYPDAPTLDPLRAAQVPIYDDIQSAARVLARLVGHVAHGPSGIPGLEPVKAGAPVVPGYFATRRLLESAGLVFPEAREVTDSAGARRAAAAIGYPVALKALGSEHKSDRGGVRVGIASEAELDEALADMSSRLHPPSFSIERVAPGGAGVELLVGVRRDHSFGPIIVVGAGGLFAELAGDVAVGLAPVAEDEAAALIRSLRIAPRLLGARGAPLLDVAAAARAAVMLSKLAALQPDIREIEINPLLVTAEGAIALDARIVTA
jgi:acetate---CoA ligase (ADP-forming)